MKRPSKRKILGALRDSGFDPRLPGRFAAILSDATVESLMYRAHEYIRDAQQLGGPYRSSRLRDAASLLAYARVLNDGA